MQSLDSQLQYLRSQIEGMGHNGHTTLAPSNAYNRVPAPVPQFRPAPGGAQTSLSSVYGASAIKELRPGGPPSVIGEEPPKRSYFWIVIAVAVLVVAGIAVAIFMIRRKARLAEEANLAQQKLIEDNNAREEAELIAQAEMSEKIRKEEEEQQRRAEAERLMKQQVSASLLKQRTPPAATHPAPLKVPQQVPPQQVPPQQVPSQQVPPQQVPQSTTTPEENARKGNEYLDRSISNVQGTIQTALQAIMSTQDFSRQELQRDESILANQGELGLRVAGVEKQVFDSSILNTVTITHPTGEIPIAGGAQDVTATELPDV